MPKKSVWNMSDFERMHFSIRGKTLRSTILFVLILSIAAIGFGFYLYTATINREYRKLTFHLSIYMEARGLDDSPCQVSTTLLVRLLSTRLQGR